MSITQADSAPSGSVTTMTDLFIEGAPDFWFGGVPRYSPDSQGYYWGVTGTVDNPLYKLGCYTDFRLRDNIQTADVRCDTVGMKASIQKRNFLEVSFNLLTLFPLSMFQKMVVRGGSVTTNPTGSLTDPSTEKMGWGEINNQLYYMCFFSKVYDPDNGDFLSFTGHRCQFVDVTEIAFTYGQPYTYRVMMRLFADSDKPSDQRFATVIRYDPSAL